MGLVTRPATASSATRLLTTTPAWRREVPRSPSGTQRPSVTQWWLRGRTQALTLPWRVCLLLSEHCYWNKSQRLVQSQCNGGTRPHILGPQACLHLALHLHLLPSSVRGTKNVSSQRHWEALPSYRKPEPPKPGQGGCRQWSRPGEPITGGKAQSHASPGGRAGDLTNSLSFPVAQVSEAI